MLYEVITGSATGTSQLTNASGIATVTSWTLGGSSADDILSQTA